MEYITLTKGDPEFESYLLGTFSSHHRALPVETYHARTSRERVTFRVVPLENLEIPPWWRIYFWSCRPDLLGLTLGPAVAAWLNHRASLAAWTMWPSWLALAGVFFLHTAVFLINDVQDHIGGTDRLSRRRGSQVIQRGWVSAAAMRRWAGLNFILAVAFGVPAFLNAPVELAIVCVLAFLGLAAVVRNWGTRYGLCDLAIIFLFGPLLTMGVALASFGKTHMHDAALGVAFGASTLWVFQVRQFENLFRSHPSLFRTFLAYRDFDRARWICVVEGILLLILFPLLGVVLRLPLLWLALMPIISWPQMLTISRLQRAASPLSSNLVNSSRLALASQFAWTVWWVSGLGVEWL
ncbi:MAG: prenyltransferase [Bdellovibrionales bacterium]